MLHMELLRYWILLQFSIATAQINLHYIGSIHINEEDNVLQHDCLRVAAYVEKEDLSRQIISYCMSESISKFPIEKNNIFPKFTFSELAKQNITSQQLYLWSAPIDIVEEYQLYLDQLLTSNNSVISKEVFFNCTLPRFGPTCQYEMMYYNQNLDSLYEIIHDYYRTYEYNPTNLTCYTHLQCNRGPSPICLDWTEICNGQVDCLDGAFDEDNCWQLEIQVCEDDEYRCTNGECIPQSFFRDDINTPDCLDGSDEAQALLTEPREYTHSEPSFEFEDTRCFFAYRTNSCWKQREDFFIDAIYSIKDDSVSEECWSALKCFLEVPDSKKQFCEKICENELCLEIINNECPDMFYSPNTPIAFGNVYLAHKKTDSLMLFDGYPTVPYICYNDSVYDHYSFFNSKISFKNKTCFRSYKIYIPMTQIYSWDQKYYSPVMEILIDLNEYTLIFNHTSEICNKSNMYQCINSSKCISINRLLDDKFNCPYGDDENIWRYWYISSTESSKNYFNCEIANKYIHKSLFADGSCNCDLMQYNWCEDEDLDVQYVRKNISFQNICDGFTELFPKMIEGQNETDETECEQWPCNNLYTRCDGLWNCPNGADEIGCYSLSKLNCSIDHHLCVLPFTSQLTCLPIEKANDGKIDCLGATDEPKLCQNNYRIEFFSNFYCLTNEVQMCLSSFILCNHINECDNFDDERFCEKNRSTAIETSSICMPEYISSGSEAEKFLCHESGSKEKQQIKYFSLESMNKSIEHEKKSVQNTLFSSSSDNEMSLQHESRCHRGLDLRVWLNDERNIMRNTCLCPPSFYGDRCQYQNQRVSLTIKFQALSDSWSTSFAIIISLIDDSEERIIHSYEQLTYLSVRDCKTKFNIYLVYANLPKNLSKNYFIHIDIYEKVSLKYRGSLLFPIKFPFLPVHRLAHLVVIPRNDETIQTCLNLKCIHGRCIKYSNNPQYPSFCQCYPGWSGHYCTIPHICNCASDSNCIGVSASNRSVCVCPNHKFGPRCLLVDATCQMGNNLTCENGGQCIPSNEYVISNQRFVCICPKGYTGDRCEIADTKISLSFGLDIILFQSIFIHFIEVIKNGIPIRSTTLRTIGVKRDSIDIYWPRPFHLVFIEFPNKIYYLAIIQKHYKQSITLTKTVDANDRCKHISELFNKTFVNLHLLRRIKYYHLPCQSSSSNLSCFYDDTHLCLCYSFEQQRLTNCFDFNHNMTFDCLGQSVCENGGQCFQDTPDCPKRSICNCPRCFYGRRCQFRTSGFGLSLDSILGYHIQPHVRITQQPMLVKVTLMLTLIFMIAGFVNGILAVVTFKRKVICEVGCGLYLLGSSITTLLTTTIFGLKFWILLLAQTGQISNRLFLQIQCICLDYILRICLNMDQWLNACVAVERASTIMKGANFQKKRSKQVAKIVIISLLILIIGTFIYDPIYRRLIDEENEDEHRIWCIASYPSKLTVFNSFLNIFHFLVPFICNLVSAIVIIAKKSHQQTNLQTHRTYKQHLKEQFQQHKHLFTASVVLVILALPRLVISFVSKCMESANDAWFFISGYFISFIPPMLTFIVFVLPSQHYKKQFHESLIAYRKTIQRHFEFIR